MPTFASHVARPTLSAVILLTVLVFHFACAKRAHDPHAAITAQVKDNQSAEVQSSTPRINLNIASARELETLPGIGKGLAARIIEHREEHGPFRRTEHLMIVRGISDRRFRALRNLITVE